MHNWALVVVAKEVVAFNSDHLKTFPYFQFSLLAISVGGGRVQTKAAVTLASVIILLFFASLYRRQD